MYFKVYFHFPYIFMLWASQSLTLWISALQESKGSGNETAKYTDCFKWRALEEQQMWPGAFSEPPRPSKNPALQ